MKLFLLAFSNLALVADSQITKSSLNIQPRQGASGQRGGLWLSSFERSCHYNSEQFHRIELSGTAAISDNF